MEELDIAAVTKRSIKAVFALVSRTFFIGIFNLIINILLTIYLSPTAFGVYYVVTAVIAFLQYFSDIGLAAALIQKKEQLTEEDLSTTFIIQQGLVISAVIFALFISPFLGKFYHFDRIEMYLLQALIISFFFSSLKTIPSVILERNLRFEKLVIPQITETITFGLIAFLCAMLGFGVNSFTFAVLARGIVGLITIYIICPWIPHLYFSKSIAKKLLSFGMPFQLNSFLALIKDDLFLAYVGKVLPLSQVGYIGFAQKWAYTPLRLIMDNVIRITFSSFSRLADDQEHLSKAIEKSLFASVFLIFPALVGMVVTAPYFILFIPKYQKWEPALLSLAFFSINAGLSAISTPLTNALNAIGKVKISLYLMIFWTIATWVLTPLAIFFFQFNGVAIASAVIATSVVGVVYITKKYIHFHLVNVITTPIISSLVMGVVIFLLSPLLVHNIIILFCMIALGAGIYVGMMYALAKDIIISDFQMILKNLKK